MSIFSFIKKLLPRTQTSVLIEEIDSLRQSLKTQVIPLFTEFVDEPIDEVFKSQYVKNLEKLFYRNWKGSKGHYKNFMHHIATQLQKLLATLDVLEEEVEKGFSKDVIRDGITLRKAAIIRAIAQIGFLVNYSVDLGDAMCRAEEHVLLNAGDAPDKSDDVTKLMYLYATLLEIYTRPSDDFRALLNDLPEVVVNEETEQTIRSVYGDKDILPAGVPAAFAGDLFFALGMSFVERQAQAYRRLKDKKKLVELRLLHLKMLREKQNDPKLEKEIEYLEDRVAAIDYKLKKMEAKAGITPQAA